jgi:hypothetical protein
VISRLSIHPSLPGRAARATLALAAVLTMAACSDGAAPRPADSVVRITPVADSVFEGDVVSLTAKVLDANGAEVPGAPVTWTAGDTTLAKVAGVGSFALLRPGTVHITARSGAATGVYDLVIGRLVVQKVELTPGILSLGRGDRVPLVPRILAQGDRAITGRTASFTSDDSLVAIIPGLLSTGAPGTALIIAVGPGSTTIRATVDGVTGTAQVGVVIADTTFALTHFEGAPLPVLITADSMLVDGVAEFDEVYADSGTLVLSGLAQERYNLNVRYSAYRVIRTGDTVKRELRVQIVVFADHGVVTVGANGSLSLLSEFIGPHLEHAATLQSDGYLVHYHIPGDDAFLDLRYKRGMP